MSDETPRSDDSAPSLSSYPPAFADLIKMFIVKSEIEEGRAHKALMILKEKDSQVADLQRRLESLENSLKRSPEKSPEKSPENSLHQSLETVPPLDLPQSSSSSSMGIWSPHPRKFAAHGSKLEKEDPSLETLYVRTRSYPETEESTGDSDCYVKCRKLLQDDICRVEKSQSPRVVEEEDLKIRQDQMTSPAVLNSSAKIDNLSFLNGSGDRYEMVIIDRATVKQRVDMAGNIISCIQQRLDEDSNKFSVRSFSNLSRKDCRNSSRSSLSSYHTPKSKFSSRFLIRRRKTTSCYYTYLNRAHKKLKWKYRQVYDKFRESLALCGKLQDDIVSLTGRQANTKEVQVSKQIQTEVATRSTTSLLQGRLDAASYTMRRRLSELQEIKTQLEESQSAVAALKKRLSRAEADAAMKDTQLIEATATSANQSSQLQHLQLQVAEMSKTKRAAEEREESSRKDLEELKTTTETKAGELKALVVSLGGKESKSALAVGHLERMLKDLEGQLTLQIVEASERLTAADAKIQQLFQAIQTFLKLLFGVHSASCDKAQSDGDLHAVRVASEILQLQPAQLCGILQASSSVNKWLRKCKRLLFEEDFAERLGCLLVEAVFEARNSASCDRLFQMK